MTSHSEKSVLHSSPRLVRFPTLTFDARAAVFLFFSFLYFVIRRSHCRLSHTYFIFFVCSIFSSGLFSGLPYWGTIHLNVFSVFCLSLRMGLLWTTNGVVVGMVRLTKWQLCENLTWRNVIEYFPFKSHKYTEKGGIRSQCNTQTSATKVYQCKCTLVLNRSRSISILFCCYRCGRMFATRFPFTKVIFCGCCDYTLILKWHSLFKHV